MTMTSSQRQSLGTHYTAHSCTVEVGFRRYTATAAAYLGQIVEAEASAKLDAPVTLTFERLRGADVQGLGRALKSLVESGATYEDALVQVGLG